MAPGRPDEEVRFEVRGELGAGGMGMVYRALDRDLGREVALKMLRGGGGGDVFRFKREFRALADLSHPNLVALHELHTTLDQWMFTMELIEGVPFHRWVRPAAAPTMASDDPTTEVPVGTAVTTTGPARRAAGGFDEARLRAALIQLVDGVTALHCAGKVHRDLKPSNVLVEATGRVVILDFGLSTDVANLIVDHTHERSAVGTPAYMSPEQAADAPLTDASDWYSIGVILYEVLTGVRPFEGAADQMMRRKQTTAPRPPGELVPGVPADLELLCLQLLERDPRRRPTGREILAALGGAASAATERIAEEAARGPFVGRAVELEALRGAWADSRDGCVVAALVGNSGIGKSALLRTFLGEAARAPLAVVLEGRCFERESVPYKALDPVIDALASYLLHTPSAIEAGTVRAAALIRLFPVLRRVPSLAVGTLALPLRSGAAAVDPIELRRHALDELRALLARIAAHRPLVIAIDDLQWGDVDGSWALAELVRGPDAPRLLALLSYRAEDDGRAESLLAFRRWNDRPVREIPVAPLPMPDLRDLWTRLGGAEGDEAPGNAAGSPLLLAEIARARARGDAPVTSVDEAVRARLAGLSPTARRLMITIATAARPLPQELLGRAAGVADPVAETQALRSDRLVRLRGGAGALVEPFHDRIRETVTAAATPDELRTAHAALASELSDADTGDRELVIEHWMGAGDLARAAADAEHAARQAEERLAFHRAAELYALALRRDDLDGAHRIALTARRAGALVAAGRLVEAAAEFRAAAGLSEGRERSTFERRSVEQLLRAGELEQGLAAARDLLARVGIRLPGGYRRLVLGVLTETVRLRLRGVAFQERPAAAIDPARLDRLDVLWTLSSGLAFVDPLAGRLMQMRLLRESLDTGELHRVLMSYGHFAGFLAIPGAGARDKVERYVAEARALGDRHGDSAIRGLIEGAGGIASYLIGDFRAAAERLAIFEELVPPSSAELRWQLDVCAMFRLTVLLALGELRELAACHPRYLRDAEERGNAYGQRALRAWRGNVAWLIRDDLDEARAQAEQASAPPASSGPFHLHHYYELVCRTHIDLYAGDGLAAHRRIEALWRRLEKAHLLRIQAVEIEGRWLRGAAAVAASATDPAALAVAVAQARALGKLDAPFARVVAAQLRGAIARHQGDRDGAITALREAATAAEAIEMTAHRQVALLRLGGLVGGDEGRLLRDGALAWMHDQGVVDPVRLARLWGPGAD